MNPREDLEAALAEAQARLDAATPGPWSVQETGGRDYTDEWWAQVEVETPDVRRGFIVGDDEQAQCDAALIVAVVNREQRAIDHATDVLARHGERPLGYIGICARCREPEPCPEIASLHTLWVVP